MANGHRETAVYWVILDWEIILPNGIRTILRSHSLIFTSKEKATSRNRQKPLFSFRGKISGGNYPNGRLQKNRTGRSICIRMENYPGISLLVRIVLVST